MSFTLRIFMVDLMAFARIKDKNTFWAFLPNQPVEIPASDGKAIKEHHPVLVLPAGGPDGGEWSTVKDLLKLNQRKRGSAWLLNREDVLIDGDFEDLPSSASIPPIGAFPDLRSHTAASFDWVPTMSEVSPQSGGMGGGLIADVPPSNLGLVARLKLAALDKANLGSYAFCKLGEGGGPTKPPEIMAFGFADLITKTATTFRQRALADVVVAKLSVKTAVTISTKRYTAQLPPRPSVKISADSGSVVDILLGNLSPNLTPAEEDPPGEYYGRHFELYYRLTEHPEILGPVPHWNKGPGLDPFFGEEEEPSVIGQMEEREESVGSYNRPICTFVELGA